MALCSLMWLSFPFLSLPHTILVILRIRFFTLKTSRKFYSFLFATPTRFNIESCCFFMHRITTLVFYYRIMLRHEYMSSLNRTHPVVGWYWVDGWMIYIVCGIASCTPLGCPDISLHTTKVEITRRDAKVLLIYSFYARARRVIAW